MDIDHISEIQAKKILDFLARKVGYDSVDVFGDLLFSGFYGTCYISSNDNCTRFLRLTDYSCIKIELDRQSKDRIARTCIKTFFNISAAGKDIVFSPKLDGRSLEVFLPKNSCLEQILIEVDLERK